MPVFFLLGQTVVHKEFIFESAPFAECHAATIEESRGNLVAAWFGGSREGAKDVGIWLSRHGSGGWTAPSEVAKNPSEPCWNPVLFQPRKGPLMLFYKVGPSPATWWGMLATSEDGGLHWSKARRLPDGILGPIKNRPMQLPNGDVLCPTSSEQAGWRVYFERTSDLGKTWTKGAFVNDGNAIAAIQPSLLRTPTGLAAIGRTRQDKIFLVESSDDAATWGPMSLISLPNPNSGTDATTLADGRYLLVYNHVPGTPGHWGGRRSPLNVAISSDLITWKPVATLEDENGQEFSYPSVIQTEDGKVHIVYTWKRKRIRHVVIDGRF